MTIKPRNLLTSFQLFSCLLVIFLYITACSKDKEEILNPGETTTEIILKEETTGRMDGSEGSEELEAKGCPNTEYPEWADSPYVLPYPIGKSYKIDLSNCSGSFHSEGRPDEFAIDFNMPIGDTITASRAGVVVRIVESGDDYSNPNNLVIVQHADSTFAQYMHLTRRGAKVELGDIVAQGDLIGLCGATGLAGYPHLHLVVSKSSYSWPYESIPITFSNTKANVKGLKSGLFYEAMPY